MRITFDEFIKKYDGKAIDFDGAYGNQCFDLYRQYCKEVLGIPQSPPTGTTGAVTIATNYLKEYLDKYENTPTGVPEKGDIVVWGKTYGPYGHVAVFIEGDVNSFISFDQNDPIGTLCHKQKHTYKGVLCWLRLKTMTKTYTQEEWDKLRAENQDNWDKWQAELLKNAGLKEQLKLAQDKHQSLIEYIITKIAPLRAFIDQSEESAKGAIIELVSLVDTLNKTISDNKKQAEKKEQELVKVNEALQGKLETLQEQFDRMKDKHAQEMDAMQEKIDKVQEKVEENNEKVKENNKFQTWIKELITKILKG